jgi:hypothetical protein
VREPSGRAFASSRRRHRPGGPWLAAGRLGWSEPLHPRQRLRSRGFELPAASGDPIPRSSRHPMPSVAASVRGSDALETARARRAEPAAGPSGQPASMMQERRGPSAADGLAVPPHPYGKASLRMSARGRGVWFRPSFFGHSPPPRRSFGSRMLPSANLARLSEGACRDGAPLGQS